MAEHDMAAKLRAGANGTFQVDGRARPPRAERRARQGLRRGRDREPIGAGLGDRQAHSVAGDRRADLDPGRRVRGFDLEANVASCFDCADPADVGDDSREHGPI